jgi:hypothetical protein
MSGIQLVTIAFSLLMGYQTYMNLRRHELGLAGGLLWMGVWLGLLVVTVIPGVFQRLNSVVRVARLLDLVTIAGLLLVTAVSYRVYISTRRLENRIEQLVRDLALKTIDPEPPA